MVRNRIAPNSNRLKNLPASHFSNQSSECHPKVFIKTFGCQMANRDSEVIAGLLVKAGFKLVDDDKKADVVIFNTCSVRKHAEDRVFSAVGAVSKMPPHDLTHKARQIKTGGTPRPIKKIIGLVGCMANNYREAIFKKAPSIDFVVGTADIEKIPEIIKHVSKCQSVKVSKKKQSQHRIIEVDSSERIDEIYHTGFHLDSSHAFVVISEGCENYCSYCVVPYVRGKFRSRSKKEILKEIKDDICAGISKITLLGQNVNQWEDKDVSFSELLREINDIDGLKEFSFMTSHPKDANTELFKAMAKCSKLKKHLHLPIQSGSSKILKLMNRGYTKEHYLDLVDSYRKIVKNGVVSTDIIVGFPGETEEDFRETYDLVKKVKFNNAYIFKYSSRPNTAALKFEDNISKQEKERRHRLILDLQRKISKCKK